MPSYKKNKNSGLWSCRFRETDSKGLSHQKRLSGFKTKKEAQYGYEDYIKQKAEQDKIERLKEGDAETQKAVTFKELTDLYMDYKKTRTKESTFYDLYMKVEKHILPHFAEKAVNDITAPMILEWQKEKSVYSYKYQTNLFGYLKSIFLFGEKYYELKNPMSKIDRPRNMDPKKELSFWSPEEFEKFISCVSGEDFIMLFKTLYIAGCRRGEALALTWDDIDFKKKNLKISKSVTFKTLNNENGYKIQTPKNQGSNRTVALPFFFIEELKAYKKWQEKNKPGAAFVFGEKKPIHPNTMERRMKDAVRLSGVKKIRVHDLRHSCASLLISKGVSIVAVSSQLGHSNVKETLNTYSHIMPDDQTLIRNTLEDLGTILGTKK